MSPRARALAFGSAGAGALTGLVLVAVVDGLVAEVLAIALISAGLGALVLLAFLEVGLSEDRERAEEDERRRRGTGRHHDERRPRRPRLPRRPT